MNAEILKGAGIDYDYGVRRFAGRAHLFEKALAKFTKDSTMARIRAAYAAGDRELLLAGAHEFKGMCGNIGLTALYDAADAIVRMLRSDAFEPEALCAAYARLDERYRAIYGAVVASMEESV